MLFNPAIDSEPVARLPVSTDNYLETLVMDRLEMMRIAEKELGKAATAEQMVGFIQKRFGECIGPKFIPIIRSTLRGQEALQAARERASRILAEDAAARTKPKVKRSRASKAD